MKQSSTYKVNDNYRCLENITRQTNDLYLLHCGTETHFPGEVYGPAKRTGYHMHFIMRGKGTLVLDDHFTYSIKENQIFLVPPNVSAYYYADMDDPWYYGWVTFDGNNAKSYLKSAGLTPDNPIRDCIVPVEQFISFIEQMFDTRELTYANELNRAGYLFLLLALMIESHTSSLHPNKRIPEYPSDVYVEHALRYIRNNYAHIKVNDIVKYVGLNRSYFTKIFKKIMNESPQEYLVKYRLGKALDLVQNSDLNIKEIANQIGYGDAFTFSKMFKQNYGLSPRDYKQKNTK